MIKITYVIILRDNEGGYVTSFGIADEIREKLQGVDGLVETYIRVTPTGYESW